MAKNIKLLLTDTVEALGIPGDVVNVRVGYARNYLLPRSLATKPSDEAIKAVAAKRADAEQALARLRSEREELIKKLQGVEITIQRSCNDLGHLYASVTQQEVATALVAAGYSVRPRDVRLNQNIKRIDAYEVPIKFEADLEASVKLWVVADRKLDLDHRREEVEVDAEGNRIEKKPGEEGKEAAPMAPARKTREQEMSEKLAERPKGWGAPAKAPAGDKAEGDKPAKGDKGGKDHGGKDKSAKGEKSDGEKKPKDGKKDKK